MHSQARQSASSQPPVLQAHVALSRILRREAHTLLSSTQGPPEPSPSASVPGTLGSTEVGGAHLVPGQLSAWPKLTVQSSSDCPPSRKESRKGDHPAVKLRGDDI